MDIDTVKVLIGATVAGTVYCAKTVFELYQGYKESEDRRIVRENMVQQTASLISIHNEQIEIRKALASDTQTISTGVAIQKITANKIDRIDKGVIQLKAMAGIPDTGT